jgi:vacuolar-type H+-ATPase subunit C/Vma6
MSPEDAQRALIDRLVAHLIHMLRYTGGAPYTLFEWLVRRYQMENLKVVMRAWSRGLSLNKIEGNLTSMPQNYALPVEKMLAAPDISALVALVPAREYAGALAPGIPRYTQDSKLFYLESALEQGYYSKAMKLAEALEGDDREPCMRIIKNEILCYNVIFVLRCVRTYELGRDAVADLVVQRGVFSDKPYVDAVASSGVERLFEAVPHLRSFNPSGRPVATIMDLEDMFARYLYRLVVSQFAASILDFGAVAAYYYLKQFELRDILRVGEGIRLGVPAGEIIKRLITAGE